MKKSIFSIFQIIITLALMFYLVQKVNLKDAYAIMKQVNIYYYLMAIFLCFIFLLLSNWRWKILLDARNIRFSFGYLLKVYLASWLFNNILPTAIGGDVIRIAYTAQRDSETGRHRTSPALAAAFVDRFIGFIGIFFFASLASGVLFLAKMGSNRYLLLEIAGLVFLMVVMLAMFSDRVHRIFSQIFFHLKIFRLGERFERAYQEIKDYRQIKDKLVWSFLLSLLVQSAIAMVWWLIALGISVNKSLLYYFLYIPAIGVITMIPVSVGGLGIRENSFVYMFNTFVGIAKEKATAISALFLIINLIFAFIGGIVFLFIKRQAHYVVASTEQTQSDAIRHPLTPDHFSQNSKKQIADSEKQILVIKENKT
ncbi:MAG: flippase-like domain-containing protein [candidate division WOR-3 bacterium]|nr:flippase-like domain-containing protein [candidate division WOR-3 bacterium]